METTLPQMRKLSRRKFLRTSLIAGAGLALYSGEIERHWIEVTQIEIALRGLAEVFDGVRIAQLSDIHMDEYTEEFYLRHAIEKINALKPDVVALTGDFVSFRPRGHEFARGAAWQCAGVLEKLECQQRYAVMGNHDHVVGANEVTEALTAHGIRVLDNAYLPLEEIGGRKGGRMWLAGLEDPLMGNPEPEKAIPKRIRGVAGEPLLLLCHGPDYADDLVAGLPAGTVDLMLSGHTHGGQIRIPLLPPMLLPPMGRRYVQGHFRLGQMQLYVNRGIGTVELPFRLACPPEITLITLRRA